MTEEDGMGCFPTQTSPKRVASALFLPVSAYLTTYTIGLDIHERQHKLMNEESPTRVLSATDINQNSFRVHSF